MNGYNLRNGSRCATREQVTPSVFLSILKERIAERRQIAQEKCEVGVRRIQGMWSKTGIDPAELFPPEIWKMIMNDLGPDEKMSIFSLHDMFKNLLEHTKLPDILLPKFIESGAMNFHVIKMPYYVRGQRRRKRPPVPFTTLRSVSKSVKDAVDTFYENILLKSLRYEITPTFVPKMSLDLILGRRGTEGKTTEILKHFMERADAPDVKEKLDFRIRSLEISIWSPKDDYTNEDLVVVNKFVNDVTRFLKQAGHNFWRFQLICRDFEDLTDAKLLRKLYKAFCMWLQHMPELKWLDIRFLNLSKKSLPPVEGLELELDGDVVPKLQNLERLELNLMISRSDILGFCKAILIRNSHIKKQYFFGSAPRIFDSELVPLISQLSNLDCLDLEVDFPFGVEMDSLRKCMNFDWQLKKLVLRLGAGYECINDVFRLLEKFPTLEDVTLELHHIFLSPTNETLSFLRLPTLKVMDVYLYNGDLKGRRRCSTRNFQSFLNLHFLLYCSNLKTIKWRRAIPTTMSDIMEKIMRNPRKGIIDFADGRKELCTSNIWNIFPRLENVSVEYTEFGGPISEKIYHNRQLVQWHTGADI